jgi:hypothetical protein
MVKLTVPIAAAMAAAAALADVGSCQLDSPLGQRGTSLRHGGSAGSGADFGPAASNGGGPPPPPRDFSSSVDGDDAGSFRGAFKPSLPSEAESLSGSLDVDLKGSDRWHGSDMGFASMWRGSGSAEHLPPHLEAGRDDNSPPPSPHNGQGGVHRKALQNEASGIPPSHEGGGGKPTLSAQEDNNQSDGDRSADHVKGDKPDGKDPPAKGPEAEEQMVSPPKDGDDHGEHGDEPTGDGHEREEDEPEGNEKPPGDNHLDGHDKVDDQHENEPHGSEHEEVLDQRSHDDQTRPDHQGEAHDGSFSGSVDGRFPGAPPNAGSDDQPPAVAGEHGPNGGETLPMHGDKPDDRNAMPPAPAGSGSLALMHDVGNDDSPPTGDKPQ